MNNQPNHSSGDKWDILLAEDNPGDVFLVRRALDQQKFNYNLEMARDGEEALKQLKRAETGEIRIDLILVDLNLPRFDGGAVIAMARAGAVLRETPIILLTSSDSPHEYQRIKELGANLYFRKPADLTTFMTLGSLVADVMKSRVTHPREIES